MKAVLILTDLYGQRMNLVNNFKLCHPGLLVDYAEQTTGIGHIAESIPSAFSGISNEQFPKPYNISIRSGSRNLSPGTAKQRNDRQELGHLPS